MRPAIALVLLVAGGFTERTAADWQLNLKPGITEISRSVFDLHMLIFYICVAIAVVVFGVMLWSIIHHRKSRGAQAHNFHESTWVEILWTLIPFVILVAMALPASQTLMAMYDKREGDLTVQITGYQWKWRYQYVGEQVDFFSNLATSTAQINNEQPKGKNYLLEVDRPLVLPVNRKIRFLLTSNDVIHSWWVPALAVKKDAIPGFINEVWAIPEQTGTYRGQCAELCGRDHGFMPVVIEVVPQAEFDQWLADSRSAAEQRAGAAERDWSLDELMAHGETVYQSQCAACHQAGGEGVAGVFPALKGSRLIAEDPDAHIDIVLNGRSGTAMQAFGQQLDAVDLAAVITYERNAWGNRGEAVTPKQILALQGGDSSAGAAASSGADSAAVTPSAMMPADSAIEAEAETAVAASQEADSMVGAVDGQALYLQHCGACHQPSGLGVNGVFPALKGSALVTGPDESHIDIVIHGKPGTAMVAFGTQLSAEQLAAIISYERSAWDNGAAAVTADQVRARLSP
ncbi:cytochrome c oxidase subunit II [Motiliproteus coralliicola]|uniref:Cytochrome c oxidase subunit 2 n=1 Tax=Motiliproteus coralliicola TaxID=2283196 RepID=A0A369WVF1_9GAMM|nr:cytochrome c oxidase subunit II [Motiliproteus coralliicola]